MGHSILLYHQKLKHIKMKVILLLAAMAATAFGEQTCYQGWDMHRMHTGDGPDRCHCYYFANENTRLNHADATAVCNGKGGWLAEIDDTDWHHVDNGWLVDKLLDIYYSKNGKPDQLGGPLTKINGGLELDHIPAIAKSIQENGHGSMPTPPCNGSIGHQTNQMIIIASNAWPLFDIQA